MTTEDVLQIKLKDICNVGMVVFVNSSDRRDPVTVYAGLYADYTLNTPCHEGQLVANDGAINCFAVGVRYVHVVYEGSSSYDILFDEIYIHEEFDAAQYGTMAHNGIVMKDKPVLGPVPDSVTESFLRISDFDIAEAFGKLWIDT